MLKSLLKSSLAHSPFWPAAAATLRPAGVTVLMYHRIKRPSDPFPGTEVERFRAQMHWLQAHCRVITPEELDQPSSHRSRGRPAVLLTFDDGYRDYHDNAYPILEALKFTAIVFLATGAMDDHTLIWTDEITWMARNSTRARLALPWQTERVLGFGDADSRDRLASVCKGFLKNIPDIERQHWMTRLREALGGDPSRSGLPRQMLSWDEVRATQAYTRYGGHTHNHPILSQLDDATMADEIATCQRRIVEETGTAPRYFAYPNGRAADFNVTTQALLRQHGFEHGYSTIEGLHRRGDDLHAIRRQHTAARDLGEFALRVLGR